MPFRPRSWLDRLARERAGLSWAQLSKVTASIRPGRLRQLRGEASELRRNLERFLLASEQRVATSRLELSALQLPGGTDWRWRPAMMVARISPSGVAAPAPGHELGGGGALWHDCAEHALIVRQVQNAQPTDLPSFGMRLETLGFTGSFLSLAVDLPPDAANGLTRDHIIRFETAIQAERPVDVYARLNIGNGPNTEEMLRHFGTIQPGEVNMHVAEYDLALTEMNERRLDKVWLDLIFERPVMNAVVVSEAIFSRHPRANV